MLKYVADITRADTWMILYTIWYKWIFTVGSTHVLIKQNNQGRTLRNLVDTISQQQQLWEKKKKNQDPDQCQQSLVMKVVGQWSVPPSGKCPGTSYKGILLRWLQMTADFSMNTLEDLGVSSMITLGYYSKHGEKYSVPWWLFHLVTLHTVAS